MVEATCVNDFVIFKTKRKDAKFCSDNCRKAYKRKELNPFGEPVSLESTKKTFTLSKDPNPFAPSNRDPNYDYEKSLAAFQKMGLQPTQWITTGLPDFDVLSRIPRGRITQIQGPYGVGKTTLCLNMIRGLTRAGKNVFYVDSEASLNPHLLAELQIDPAYFTLYNESAYFEDIAEVIRKAAKSGDYDLVIFDSLASTTTKTIAEDTITASNIGQKAKLMHKLVQLTQMDFKNTNTAFVVINQEREVIGSYVPQKYTPGGTAVPYAASLIIALKTIKSWRFPKSPTDGIFKGHEVEATIIKSKVNQPWRTQKFKLYYPQPTKIEEVSDEDAF